MIALALAFVLTSTSASASASASTSAPMDITKRIEAHERVELGSVSYDGHLGKGSVELIALEELGDDALPYLLAMSSSKSPVARVVAAAGLRLRQEPIARVVLSRLEHDDADVQVMRGCCLDMMTVGEAVRDLALYEVLIRPRATID